MCNLKIPFPLFDFSLINYLRRNNLKLWVVLYSSFGLEKSGYFSVVYIAIVIRLYYYSSPFASVASKANDTIYEYKVKKSIGVSNRNTLSENDSSYHSAV